MNVWTQAMRSAVVSGTMASVTTTAALALLAKLEARGALQPTNATSHWLHGESAGDYSGADAAHTLLGYSTHHASAVFWAFPFEYWLLTHKPRSPGAILRDAGATAVVAAAVDYGLAPRRATPGWEEVLSPRSIALVYGALALGLAAGGMLTQDLRRRAWL